MKRKLVIAALILVFNPFTLGFLWIGGAMWSDSHPETGVNVPSVDWLPESATNVSYYKTYSWTAYEFDIEETALRQWASDRRMELEPVKDQKRIERYSWRKYAESHRDETVFDEAYFAEEAKHYAVVANGLSYYFIQSNGGHTYLLYDRDTGRAYYSSTPR